MDALRKTSSCTKTDKHLDVEHFLLVRLHPPIRLCHVPVPFLAQAPLSLSPTVFFQSNFVSCTFPPLSYLSSFTFILMDFTTWGLTFQNLNTGRPIVFSVNVTKTLGSTSFFNTIAPPADGRAVWLQGVSFIKPFVPCFTACKCYSLRQSSQLICFLWKHFCLWRLLIVLIILEIYFYNSNQRYEGLYYQCCADNLFITYSDTVTFYLFKKDVVGNIIQCHNQNNKVMWLTHFLLLLDYLYTKHMQEGN